MFFYGAADAAPAIPAAESTLGSHPCVALSSAQVLPEWINRNLAGNAFASNGDNPLNFVSHSRGSLQKGILRRYLAKMTGLSRAQVTRLIRRYQDSGQVSERNYRRNRFTGSFVVAAEDSNATVGAGMILGAD